jgi:hypothetical protein
MVSDALGNGKNPLQLVLCSLFLKGPLFMPEPEAQGRTDPLIASIGGNINKYLPLFLSLLIRN